MNLYLYPSSLHRFSCDCFFLLPSNALPFCSFLSSSLLQSCSLFSFCLWLSFRLSSLFSLFSFFLWGSNWTFFPLSFVTLLLTHTYSAFASFQLRPFLCHMKEVKERNQERKKTGEKWMMKGTKKNPQRRRKWRQEKYIHIWFLLRSRFCLFSCFTWVSLHLLSLCFVWCLLKQMIRRNILSLLRWDEKEGKRRNFYGKI